MVFRVELARHAELDIAEAVNFIAEESPVQAARWFEDLFALLETLRELPERNPLIQESESLRRSLRSLHHHSHRVIYEVEEAKGIVYVVRVYHGARRPLTRKDLP